MWVAMVEATMPRAKPLAGVRVVELTRFIAGPYCGMLLADLGAEVLKVESPRGDPARLEGPWLDGESMYFAQMNRNKRGIRLDLHSSEGLARLRELVEDADILLDNHRPGVLEAMGFAPDHLAAINSRCITVRVAGFGHHAAERPALDPIIQCVSGMALMSGVAGGEPTVFGAYIVDVAAALTATIGALAALYHRSATGAADVVRVNMLDVGLALMETWVGAAAIGEGDPARLGNQDRTSAPANTYRTRDGWVFIHGGSDASWNALLAVMGTDPHTLDPSFSTAAGRLAHRADVDSFVAAWAVERSTGDVESQLLAAGIPVARVNTLSEALNDEALRLRSRLRHVKSSTGHVFPVVAAPLDFGSGPLDIEGGIPE